MDNAIHIFQCNNQWIVKKTSAKNKYPNASYKKRDDAIKFALACKKREEMNVFIHAKNGMVNAMQ